MASELENNGESANNFSPENSNDEDWEKRKISQDTIKKHKKDQGSEIPYLYKINPYPHPYIVDSISDPCL